MADMALRKMVEEIKRRALVFDPRNQQAWDGVSTDSVFYAIHGALAIIIKKIEAMEGVIADINGGRK